MSKDSKNTPQRSVVHIKKFKASKQAQLEYSMKGLKSLNSVTSRIKRLVSRCYNAQFYLMIAPIDDHIYSKTFQRLIKFNGCLKLEDKVYYAFKKEDELIAIAEVKRKNPLTYKEIQKLKQVLDLTIGVLLIKLLQINNLNSLEKIYIKNQQSTKTNIIPIRRHKNEITPTPSSKNSFSETNTPCFIESKSQNDIFKMAHEIHELSQRSFFISLDDIKNNSPLNHKTLIGLYSCTIYISDVEQICWSDQMVLTKIFKFFDFVNGPQIIVGSQLSLEDLKNKKSLNSEFLQKISEVHLRMTQSFSFYKKMGVSSFFFASLT